LLYETSNVHAVPCVLPADCPEQLTGDILQILQVICHVEVCRRTPSVGIYSSLNHNLLQDIISDIISELAFTMKHFMLMGDCYYRFLSWSPRADDNDIIRKAGEFVPFPLSDHNALPVF